MSLPNISNPEFHTHSLQNENLNNLTFKEGPVEGGSGEAKVPKTIGDRLFSVVKGLGIGFVGGGIVTPAAFASWPFLAFVVAPCILLAGCYISAMSGNGEGFAGAVAAATAVALA